MRKSLKTIAAASALIVGLAATSAVYAQQGPSGMTGGNPGGMMGGGSMMGQGPGNMMGGQGGMMGQMGLTAENWMTSMQNWMTSMMTNHGRAPNGQGEHPAQPVAPQHSD